MIWRIYALMELQTVLALLENAARMINDLETHKPKFIISKRRQQYVLETAKFEWTF